MKSLIPTLLITVIFFGCGSETSQEAIEEAINGIYVRASEHEFGSEHDTVIVSSQNSEANEYKFIRKWQYARVLDGKPLQPEYKVTTTTAVYDLATKSLTERETGDAYSFDPAKGVLFAGSTSYKKLN